jgi:hypothetical protein
MDIKVVMGILENVHAGLTGRNKRTVEFDNQLIGFVGVGNAVCLSLLKEFNSARVETNSAAQCSAEKISKGIEMQQHQNAILEDEVQGLRMLISSLQSTLTVLQLVSC